MRRLTGPHLDWEASGFQCPAPCNTCKKLIAATKFFATKLRLMRSPASDNCHNGRSAQYFRASFLGMGGVSVPRAHGAHFWSRRHAIVNVEMGLEREFAKTDSPRRGFVRIIQLQSRRGSFQDQIPLQKQTHRMAGMGLFVLAMTSGFRTIFFGEGGGRPSVPAPKTIGAPTQKPPVRGCLCAAHSQRTLAGGN